MRNKKRIIAILLCIVTVLSILTACKNNEQTNDPTTNPSDTSTTNPTGTNTPDNSDTTTPTLPELPEGFIPGDPIIDNGETPTQPENDNENKNDEEKAHDKAYYLSLNGNDTSKNLDYSGQVVINKITYAKQPTFKELMERYPEMEMSKDRYVESCTEIHVAFNELHEQAFLTIKNLSNNRIKLINASITGVSLPIDEKTKLVDVIGEQLKPIDKEKTFIDAAIDIFGIPFSVTEESNGELRFFYDYSKCTVYINYNIETNTGRFEIFYK